MFVLHQLYEGVLDFFKDAADGIGSYTSPNITSDWRPKNLVSKIAYGVPVLSGVGKAIGNIAGPNEDKYLNAVKKAQQEKYEKEQTLIKNKKEYQDAANDYIDPKAQKFAQAKVLLSRFSKDDPRYKAMQSQLDNAIDSNEKAARIANPEIKSENEKNSTWEKIKKPLGYTAAGVAGVGALGASALGLAAMNNRNKNTPNHTPAPNNPPQIPQQPQQSQGLNRRPQPQQQNQQGQGLNRRPQPQQNQNPQNQRPTNPQYRNRRFNDDISQNDMNNNLGL